MRKIKYVFLTLLFSSTIFSCSEVDFGNINENKNGSVEPATSGLLAGAIMTWGTFSNRTGVTIPTLYVQYQSQVTYTDEMLYAQSPYGWGTYYQGILFPLSEIIRINSADGAESDAELVSQGSVNNQIGVATILRAMAMKRVTDIYGEAPFSAAFQGLAEITPEYDTQENIYKSLITQVKAARDMINASETAVKGDIIFNGNMNRWKKLANSLLMQMSLQLSKVYPGAGEYAAGEFSLAYNNAAGAITTVADEAWFTYQDLVGFRSPWFANRTADYFMSAEFINAMNGCGGVGNDCPTVSGHATANPTSTRVADTRKLIYVRHDHQARNGVPYGYNDLSGASRAQMSTRYYWNATATIPIMTASYTHLNIAEGAALGWITGVNATSRLRWGINTSFETLYRKVLPTHLITLDKAAYDASVPPMDATNSIPDLTLLDSATYNSARRAQIGVDATLLQVIREEKWKSLFGQAYDAWAEWRRTAVPTLLPATDSYNGGIIPRRFMYPGEEASLNNANYEDAVSRLSPAEDKNFNRIWWDD